MKDDPALLKAIDEHPWRSRLWIAIAVLAVLYLALGLYVVVKIG